VRGSQKQVNYMSKIINESIGINESLLPQDIEGPQKGQFHPVSFLALAKAAKCLGHALQTTPGLQRRQVRGSIAGTSTGSSNAYVASASLKDRTNLHKQTAASLQIFTVTLQRRSPSFSIPLIPWVVHADF
jgi:hypothetical protein